MPQFEVSTFLPQVFWLLIVFSFLYFGIAYWVLPSVKKIFDLRSENLEGLILKAEALKREAEQLQLKSEQHLAQARSEAQLILASAAEEIKNKHKKKEAAFSKEIDAQFQQAELKLQEAQKTLFENLEKVATPLVQDMIFKVAHFSPSEESIKPFIQQSKKRNT
jgi:F-type H+-transporting ATPase subunit b